MAKRIALVTDQLPLPNLAGHLSLNFSFLQALAHLGYEVGVVLTEPRLPALRVPWRMAAGQRISLYGTGIRLQDGDCVVTAPRAAAKIALRGALNRLPKAWSRGLHRLRNAASGGWDVIVGKFTSRDQAQQAARWVDEFAPDFVFVDTIFRAPVLDALRRRHKSFVLTHDIFHQRLDSLRARGFKVLPDRLDREAEARLLDRFDVVIANNEEDGQALRRLLPDKAIVVVHKPLAASAPAVEARDPHRCLFVGSKALHNVDGLRWFLAAVWPSVVARVPAARLDVFGTVCAQIAAPPAGVVLHGAVEDLVPHYHRASVGICPLKAGSGIKIKALDYISHGLPCVTTTIGAQGFPLNDDYPFLVSDEAEAQAAQLSRLLNDEALAGGMRERAYRYCGLFSEDRAFETLRRHME